MTYLFAIVTNFFLDHVHGKKNNIIPFIGIGILAWLAGAASKMTTTDYPSYLINYDNSSLAPYNHQFEWGYMWLSRIFAANGVTYADFRLILFIVSFIILTVAILRFTKNLGSFVWVFAIFPFFNEATQARNFFMISIALLGLSFLQKKNVKNIIIAIGLILLSASMHSSGYIFLIIIPLSFLSEKYVKIFVQLIIGFFVILTIVQFIPGLSGLLKNIITKVSLHSSRTQLFDKLNTSYAAGSSKIMLIEIALSYFSMLGLGYYFLKINSLSTEIKNKLKLLFLISLTGLVALPFLVMSIQYQRFQRNSFAPIIIAYALIREHKDEIDSRILLKIDLMMVGILLLAVIAFYGVLVPQEFVDSIPYLVHWKSL